ncbi:MAG: hypothetical protein AUG49_23140 [Catenulispora sp. 13_1_20CM_3_70_7]|nr:MAG: hypothetical protein AUG49_23140 [Catenulispora sp. 13_1_20CM_3_70_7]
MSQPIDLRAPANLRRDGDGPDLCAVTTVTADSADAVDDRGWTRVVSADFDMGAWFDAPTPSPDAESHCF